MAKVLHMKLKYSAIVSVICWCIFTTVIHLNCNYWKKVFYWRLRCMQQDYEIISVHAKKIFLEFVKFKTSQNISNSAPCSFFLLTVYHHLTVIHNWTNCMNKGNNWFSNVAEPTNTCYLINVTDLRALLLHLWTAIIFPLQFMGWVQSNEGHELQK